MERPPPTDSTSHLLVVLLESSAVASALAPLSPFLRFVHGVYTPQGSVPFEFPQFTSCRDWKTLGLFCLQRPEGSRLFLHDFLSYPYDSKRMSLSHNRNSLLPDPIFLGLRVAPSLRPDRPTGQVFDRPPFILDPGDSGLRFGGAPTSQSPPLC